MNRSRSKAKKKVAADVLEQSSELFKIKSIEYGDGYKKLGKILHSFFPDGVVLRTQGDFARMANFVWLCSKMNRYSSNLTNGGHIDSAEDMVVYSAILREHTGEN